MIGKGGNVMLTKEQKQFYDENGYLMVEDVITSEQLKKTPADNICVNRKF